MKRWIKALLTILLLLIAVVVAVFVWQRENIMAAYTALTRDPEKIAADLEDVRDSYRETIRDQAEIEFTPPSLEQNEGLLNGVLTPEEVKDALGVTEILDPKPAQTTAVTTEAKATASTAAATTAATTQTTTAAPKGPTAQELADRCVAELTACQVDLMAQLAGMKKAAVAQWNALPADQRTSTKLKEIGLAGLAECYKLEKVIDAEVREILARCREELRGIGADTKILDTLWNYYLDEKNAQKAYYINKYLD